MSEVEINKVALKEIRNVCNRWTNTIVYIDGSLFSSATSRLKKKIDFKLLRSFMVEEFDANRINYYVTIDNAGETDDKFGRLFSWLVHNGFNVIRKRQRTVNRLPMRECLVHLTVDALVNAYNNKLQITNFVFFVGDDDYSKLFEEIKRLGYGVTLIGIYNTDEESKSIRSLNPTLHRSVDNFIELSDLLAASGAGSDFDDPKDGDFVVVNEDDEDE
jgi:hypothetical protein